jgi:hypothetical protein
MENPVITLSGSQAVEFLRYPQNVDLQTKVASAGALLKGDRKSLSSRLLDLRSRSFSLSSADVLLRGTSNEVASAIAPLGSNPVSATVSISNANKRALSNIVRMGDVVDWVSARVLLSLGALASSFVTALRGVSISSAQVTVRGSQSSVVSSITKLPGVVSVLSLRLKLRSDAKYIASALTTLRGSGVLDVSANVNLGGGIQQIASGIQRLSGNLPVSLRIGLVGKANEVVSALVSLSPASYRVNLREASQLNPSASGPSGESPE